jgi:hypothetical protein
MARVDASRVPDDQRLNPDAIFLLTTVHLSAINIPVGRYRLVSSGLRFCQSLFVPHSRHTIGTTVIHPEK